MTDGNRRGWLPGVGLMAIFIAVLLSGCDQAALNSPYSRAESEQNVVYSSFSERPKHLDPVRSYSSNEYTFLGQIYEPLLQYHYLKRPYQLVPLAAEQVPVPRYLDAAGAVLPEDAGEKDIATSEYEIRVRKGVRYQPHPAFAAGRDGDYTYHSLSPDRIAAANKLSDFPETGSREMTAADYIYQIKRLANPRLHSPIAGLIGQYIIGFKEFGREIVAVTEKQQQATGSERPYVDLRKIPLEGVQQTGRYSFMIRVRGKYPQLVYWMAMPFFSPMPWEADRFYSQPGMDKRNINLNWYPVGTGPFMLSENNPNLRMVLERNPNFYGEHYPDSGEKQDTNTGLLRDAGKTMPFIDKAIYSLEKESIPYWNKFLQGYYDTSGVSSDSFDQAVQFSDLGEVGLTDPMRKKGIDLLTAVTTSIFYMGFNMADPVIGGESERSRLLRRAISIAVDMEENISIFSNGRGVAAQGPIPPGIFGYRPGAAGINQYVYDVVDGRPKRKSIAVAKELLNKAGYPNGRDAKTGQALTLYFDTASAGPDGKARLNWMRKQFAKLGVQLVIRATDYNRFQDKMRKGKAQIFMWGWNADYPDPENFMFLLYGPNSKLEHGGENASNYNNPRFNALFDQMKNMSNGPERQQIIDEMLKILRRDAPWSWGFHPKAFSLFHSWYSNVKPNLMANNTLKYKRVDPELRSKLQREWNRPIFWPLWSFILLLIVTAIPAVVVYRRHERSAAQ
ncbi:MAG: peptide ABC transporter substrate-binding protein [Gammaproteobacteria bacterium]|nr:peptide ABC transporter substrate-binding protein [Gammaproteobacteria bacterium]